VFALRGTEPGVLRLTATGQDAFARETAVLDVLRSVGLPEHVLALLPRRLATGTVGGLAYVVDEELPGHTAELHAGQPTWRALESAALGAVDALHRATAQSVVVDDQVLDHWVEQPLAVVTRMVRQLPGVTPGDRLPRLRAELRQALAGRTVTTSWVHGDYWAGNLLALPDGRLSGIVDWDLACAGELAVHDYLHLLLYRRWAVAGQELGDAVCTLLRDDRAWTEDERAALAQSAWVFADVPPPPRVLLLLQWLRHVAAVSVQQQRYVTHSVRVWELRNVHRVLKAL
jgi:aminoglycoside phosphotransferase (APT) family kinase protein